jgi:hypothetical protein
MGEEAIAEYGAVMEAYGPENAPHFLAWMAEVIRHGDAEDERLSD